jgi:hypothetical protein
VQENHRKEVAFAVPTMLLGFAEVLAENRADRAYQGSLVGSSRRVLGGSVAK